MTKDEESGIGTGGDKVEIILCRLPSPLRSNVLPFKS